MLRILLLLFILTSCNNSETSDPEKDSKLEDQNKSTDTRVVSPSDTANKYDTGSYDKMSDELRDK